MGNLERYRDAFRSELDAYPGGDMMHTAFIQRMRSVLDEQDLLLTDELQAVVDAVRVWADATYRQSHAAGAALLEAWDAYEATRPVTGRRRR